MRPIDLSLYLVTHRDAGLSLEDFFKIIFSAVEGGVTIVQLREKETSTREMISIGKRLLLFLKPLGIPLIINDRVDIAHAIGADGVHLGQSDLSVPEARAILGKKAIVGLSVESLAQAQAAPIEDLDYLAASPTFPTLTKKDCPPAWGLKGLRRLCAVSQVPVIAIGGIHERNVQEVIASGARGVAVVSAIFHAPCPKTAASMIIKKMKGYGL